MSVLISIYQYNCIDYNPHRSYRVYSIRIRTNKWRGSGVHPKLHVVSPEHDRAELNVLRSRSMRSNDTLEQLRAAQSA
jgi:hypothetical protein